MDRFNTFIGRRNFKKIFVIYVITAVVCTIICGGIIGYIYKDKINLAVQYENVSETLKRSDTNENIKQSIDSLAASSDDICSAFLLDSSNNIIYSAKKSDLVFNSPFELKKTDGSKFLQSKDNPDALFRFVKKDEFMLSAVFADDFKEIHDEYDEDTFYLGGFSDKELYLISMPGKTAGGTKAYVITNPVSVKYGTPALKITAGIIMLLFMLYWIIAALWVYQNAEKSKLSAPVWGIITLFTNLFGVLVYLIYKNINGSCAFCGAVQPKGNMFCTFCGKKIGISCGKCGQSLAPADKYCPKCGHKQA